MAGKGGWGRGRGRGGSSLPAAATRDDDGNVVLPSGNEMDLPALPKISEESQQLLTRWHALARYWKQSPYHIKAAPSKAGKTLEAALERSKAAGPKQKPPLSSMLTLDSHYFPQELFSATDKRMSAKPSSALSRKDFWLAQASKKVLEPGPRLFEHFAKLETKEGAGNSAAVATVAAADGEPGSPASPDAKEGGAKEGEEGEDEDAALGEEDDEDGFVDDDDYYQGEMYDDDEGYDDFNDDGDDGATF